MGADEETVGSTGLVSTGRLPAPDEVARCVAEAHAIFKTQCRRAQLATSIRRWPGFRAICSVSASSAPTARSMPWATADHAFSIMSVSKPFVFALVCQRIGAARAHELLGVNSTGLPFNSLEAVERSADGRTNPMVNARRDGRHELGAGRHRRRQVGVHPGRDCPALPAGTLP